MWKRKTAVIVNSGLILFGILLFIGVLATDSKMIKTLFGGAGIGSLGLAILLEIATLKKKIKGRNDRQ